MSLRRLSAPTKRLLSSSQTVPSFEEAVCSAVLNSIQFGAKTIRVTIQPEALRFVVSDNGPGFSETDWPLALEPGCTSLKNGRGQSLASLAEVASVELHTRSGDFCATKLVRGGKILEDTVVHGSSEARVHKDLEQQNGVVLDVWELFFCVPVRRRAEATRHPSLVSEQVRERVVAFALANPHVAILLESDNGFRFYSSTGSGSLSANMIQGAFGTVDDFAWRQVRINAAVRVDGFLARNGCRSSGIALVSFESQPVPAKTWVHKAVDRAWKLFIARRGRAEANRNKYPCYVLNCFTRESSNSNSASRLSFLQKRHSDDAEENLFSALYGVLVGVSAQCNNTRQHAVNCDQLLSLSSTRKRKLETPQERFSEALISKRVKKPQRSSWASMGTRRLLSRPLSAGSGRQGGGKLRNQSSLSRVGIRRPFSAEGVDSACKRFVPGWSNPCLRSKAQVPCSALAAHDEDMRGVPLLFDRSTVRIARETIPELRVLGQVDRKFIMVVDEHAVLYAVDQHAASERYMYETLLNQATQCKANSWTLTSPVAIDLCHRLRATAKRCIAALERWGWNLRLHDGQSAEIVSVPRLKRLDVVLNKGGHLQTYLESLACGAIESATPRPILDAVAKSACHSAVRFGDILSTAQCRSIISSLAVCKCPFLCAHGRPSIVPLAVLEGKDENSMNLSHPCPDEHLDSL